MPARPLGLPDMMSDPASQASWTQCASDVHIKSGLKPHHAQLSDPDVSTFLTEEDERVGSGFQGQALQNVIHGIGHEDHCRKAESMRTAFLLHSGRIS